MSHSRSEQAPTLLGGAPKVALDRVRAGYWRHVGSCAAMGRLITPVLKSLGNGIACEQQVTRQ
jgi:hypothetical protein